MEIEQEINNYFNLFGWNMQFDRGSRVVSVLPNNWNNLEKEIQNKYLEYINSPEFTLSALRKMI